MDLKSNKTPKGSLNKTKGSREKEKLSPGKVKLPSGTLPGPSPSVVSPPPHFQRRPSAEELSTHEWGLSQWELPSQESERVVIVPRSRGGFSFGRVTELSGGKTRCPWELRSQDSQDSQKHPLVSVTVTCWTSQGWRFKRLPLPLVGIPKKSNEGPKKGPTEAAPSERTLGGSPTDRDLGTVVVGMVAVKFHKKEWVLVVGTGNGGMRYGQIVEASTITCPMGPHPIKAWSVEGLSSSPVTLPEFALGKLIPLPGESFADEELLPEVPLEGRRERESLSDEEDEEEREEEAEEEEEEEGVESFRRVNEPEEEKVQKKEEEEVEGEEIILWGSNPLESPKAEPPIPSTEKNSTSPPSHSLENAFVEVSPSVAKVESQSPPNGSNNGLGSLLPSPSEQRGGILSVGKVALQKKVGKKRSTRKHLIVVDGPNVAKKHGKDTFSGEGIQLALQYYQDRGHEVVAFLPAHYLHRKPQPGQTVTLGEFVPKASNIPLLLELEREGLLVLTPPQDYDDSYCIEYARAHQGCIVSNDRYEKRSQVTCDRYWDHVDKLEGPKKKVIREWLHSHLISFTFVRDEFLPNPDFEFPPL